MKKRDSLYGIVFLLPSIILFSVFIFYPLIKTIYYSFYLTDFQGLPSIYVGLENYRELLLDPYFHDSLKATMLFVIYTVPLTIILALFLSLLANEKLVGIRFYRTIFSSSIGISASVSAVIWLYLFHPSIGFINNFLGLFNIESIGWLTDPKWALISVSIATIWMNLGFAFLIILGGLQNIDKNLYLSASIDGASYFYKLRRITIPMLSPTLFFITTVTLINSFQSFGQIDILTGGGPDGKTNILVYSIFKEAFENYNYGVASAQSIILFFIVLVITILQFKFSEKKVFYQ